MSNSDEILARRKNVIIILEYSKICPFRWMKNLYFCFYCELNFSDPKYLRDHNSSNHNQVSNQQIKNAMKRVKKFELVKVDVNDSSCKLCPDILADFKSFKIHLLEHKTDFNNKFGDGVLPFKLAKENFDCVMCEEIYTDFKALNQHMNVHFQNFICEQCGSGFMTPDRLRCHTLTHGTGSFNCEACDKVYRTVNAKNEHYALIHRQVKRHRCPHCPETFKNYFQRTKHITVDHGLKTKEFKCNFCPKVFLGSGKLGHHVRAVHLKLKNYSCNVCEWKFYSKTELKEHMIRHGGEKKHQCPVCKKSYARKYTLREHMRIHDNDRRFSCTVCGKNFVQNCSLKHHMKIHHSVVLSGDPTVVYHNSQGIV